MNAPTLNAAYNRLLADWARQGYPSPPACEECDCDLTGKDVHDVGWGWVGDCCRKGATEDDGMSDEDLRRHERRQMGIVS